jgi:hypothetical protein
MTLVNKKPSILRMELHADESQKLISTITDTDYHKSLQFIIEQNKKKLVKALSTREQLKKEHDALSVALLEITSEITAHEHRSSIIL